MRSRPVAPRASRTALMTASVPDDTKRTCSMPGYDATTSSASSISGVHGALKAIANDTNRGAHKAGEGFDAEQLKRLHAQQVKCVEYIDGLIGSLMEKAPENTHFIVTADHGELFGEDGYFGHGPIMHEKCFEIPFVEGRAK